ncbi:hypothetical protein OPKNFCMD_3000 [Methylobacterium crusticola]|uniref:EAL domain-containing protein n=1 Tax=Methylobacterium crusticola TaxID=1697972 RepID=A0ABQ4QY80_9HYPH|nr:EAL domain-containing protein [Methylobacterium crusticola]GJD50263.1 hypothetical protein OPKNFCMD_3000 [Methylobacterium crusticola]
MLSFASLSTRLVAATLATAAFTLTCLVALVAVRADTDLHDQAVEVSRWSEAQLAERLLSDVSLAHARLQVMREDVNRRFGTIAHRADVAQAVQSGNTVLIAEVLQPALALADIDGAVVVDTQLRPLGAGRLDADLLKVQAALREVAFAPELRALTASRSTVASPGFSLLADGSDALARALAAPRLDGLVDVFAQPVLDEFSDVSALIVGYRHLRAEEPALVEFSRLSDRDVVVLRGEQVLSAAGRPLGPLDGLLRPGSPLLSFGHAGSAGRCVPVAAQVRICAAAPLAERDRLAAQVVGLGGRHIRALLVTLAAAALGAILLFSVVSTAVSRQITRPLRRITDAVREVAGGNWRIPVIGTERRDEVGAIARALVLLERSLEERDLLREDVIVQNTKLLGQEGALRDQNARFDAALNNMSQGLCMFDPDGRLTIWNGRVLEIYRLPAASLRVGADVEALRGPLQIPPGWRLPDHHARIVQAPPAQTRVLPDGRRVEVVARPIVNGGWVETHEDVTERHRAQARIAHMAMFDALTGLSNRASFNERLASALAGRAEDSAVLTVLCLDLDDFKRVNDTLGHACGDALLREVATRLREGLAQDAVAARLGGDEFAVFLPLGEERARGVADGILARLVQPYLIGGKVVTSAASIGVAAASSVGQTADDLLSKADLALYDAKAQGRGRVCVFDPAMEARFQHRRWLEHELREALRTQAIAVHYQPLIDLRTDEVCAFEALSRWTHPERGPISPGEFIPLAEEVGLIDTLGEYVLRRACADAVAWPSRVRVAVNVSPNQFRHDGLCGVVASALADSGLPGRRLELEVTESVVLADDSGVFDKLHELRGLGIRFSMDDFGTGYSSLSSLRSFPFDKIKLDRSFLQDSLTRSECATIVRIVGDLGGSLRMTTTAEGVETLEQLEFLRAHGFSEAQGFLFGRAMPADEALALIARWRTPRAA